MRLLICRVQRQLCALPLDDVIETMRPLPAEPVAGTPPFVRGLALIRGAAVPVVDAGRLLEAVDAVAGRFVTVRVGARVVALAVEQVLGIREIAPTSLETLPPLLRGGDHAIEAIGALDAELLLMLRGARLVPETLWATLDAVAAPAIAPAIVDDLAKAAH